MRIERGPDPGPFAKHTDYKLQLRPLFRCRCAYCFSPDEYLGGEEAMTVDHFKPVGRYPELRLKWSNLYYACIVCNSHFKKDHPTPDEEAAGKQFVDPCAEDPDEHFRMVRDPGCGDYCRLKPLSNSAEYTIFRLKFNHRRFLRDLWRSIDREERRLVQERRKIDQGLAQCNKLIQYYGVRMETRQIRQDYQARRSQVVVKLAEIKALRPFPIEEAEGREHR